MPIHRLAGQANKQGFAENIEELTVGNSDFRQVLYTSDYAQLVLMSIPEDEDIGEETHGVDQFFRIEEGVGTVTIDGKQTDIEAGFGLIVPAGATHNIANTGEGSLKLYSIYSPPHHAKDTVHETKDDAEGDTETFNGKTTE